MLILAHYYSSIVYMFKKSSPMEERLASQQRAGNGPLCPTARFGPLYDQGQHRRDGRIDGSYGDSMENHGKSWANQHWKILGKPTVCCFSL